MRIQVSDRLGQHLQARGASFNSVLTLDIVILCYFFDGISMLVGGFSRRVPPLMTVGGRSGQFLDFSRQVYQILVSRCMSSLYAVLAYTNGFTVA